MIDNTYDESADPYAYQTAPSPFSTPYFSAGMGENAPPGAVPFTGQSQGNQDASVAAGDPNNLPVNPAAPASSGYAGQKDLGSLWSYWRSSHPVTSPDMPGFVKFLNQNGIAAAQATHAGGLLSDDKLVINGQTLDFGSSLGSPDGKYFDTPNIVGGDNGSAGIDPSYLAPFTRPFVMPTDAALPQFKAPPAFAFPDFKAPTANDVLSDPGYQFRADQGRKQVETSASAAGLLGSGGTLADILGLGQQLASQEYGNVFSRNFNTWGANRQNAADTYKTNYGSQTLDPYQFDTARANTSYDRAASQYQNDQNLFFANEQNPFNKLFNLSQLGFNAANA